MSTPDLSLPLGHRPRPAAVLLSVALSLALALGLLASAPAPKADAATCPCTVFAATATPANPVDSDTVPIELGMKFRADQDGFVTGVRFYKGTGNSGTHTGSLWNTAGTQLATVTFSGETATGWQQATFAAPVAVTANTTYVISYYAPVGRYASDEGYFASQAVVNSPLTGLQNGTDGGNGVYRYGAGGGFPASTYNSTNYWVDAVFTPSGSDTTKPTVTGRTPAAGATGVAVTSGASATFSEPVQAGTIAFTLTGSSAVAATTAYDSGTRTVTLTPNAALAASTTYTVNLSGAKDTAGNTMDPISWTFTTAAAATGCPCSIWPTTAVPSTAAANDNSAVELGVKFRSNQAGYITGIKFYKGTGNTGTHTGSLWNRTGTTRLATVTFTGESATGWQTATFGAPVSIAANTTYVASYYAPVGRYAVNSSYFSSATSNGPLTALANGTDGGNGVYAYGGSSFPSNTYQSSNYWVDVVFSTTAADTTAPTVVAQSPAPGSSGAPTNGPVTATFSEPVTASSVTMELRNPANAIVPSTLTYDSGTQKATLTPNATLADSTVYTAKVLTASDPAGNALAAPVTWTFTSAAPAPPGPEQGPGGPIAVVTSSGNPYSKFLAEILRTEGLNEFATIDVSTLSAATLASYDVVVLGAVTVTAAQATTLTTWVNGGGNLIALKPNATLSSLAGITAASGTLTDAYLKVDTTTAPGAGVVTDSIQFHGPADKYTADSGTQTVAALWSNATTATANPAVTLRSVGTSGGQVATFTYDLARSIALTRQGNIAWAGTERDGQTPIRPDDYFFGGTPATDWVNLSKVAIPQADEQQRLLANIIQTTNRDKKPLPRFWYFPKTYKAVLVGTGDDHASSNGTAGRFDQMIANSPSGCTAADWTCYRYSSYMWNGTPLTNSAAAAYNAQGFELGLHPRTTPSDPSGDYTASSIAGIYADQLATFRSSYPSLPNQQSVRMHAIVFSDWSSQPKTETANGIRMDTNYYYWPSSWVQDRPGFMTGSGMAMRFTDTDGSMIDNFQAATQMTDESGQSYPSTLNALVNNALGANGFYGSFVANFHTDQATEPQSDALIAVAQANNIPIVSARQLLTWLDGRNASSYKNLTWNANQLSFTVSVGSGAANLTSMLPTAGPNGTTLSGITRGGSAVVFSTSTIKGLEYATFPAAAGAYVATYSGGSGAAVEKVSAKAASTDSVAAATNIRSLSAPVATANAKTVSWTTTKNATSQVLLGTSAGKLTSAVKIGNTTRKHTATLTGLKPATTYYYRVASTDTTGARTVSPAADEAPSTFTTAALDKTPPVLKTEPTVTALPGGTALVTWSTAEATSSLVRTGTTTKVDEPIVKGEDASTEHSVLLTNLDVGKTYYVATDSLDKAGNKLSTAPIKVVTPGEGVAQVMAPSFRIGDLSGSAAVQSTGLGQITLAGKALLAQKGTYTSGVLDAMQMVDWDRVVAKTDTPTGTKLSISYRVGSTSKPDGTWSDWAPVGDRNRTPGSGRFLQYRVDMSATAKAVGMPVLYGIGFSHNGVKLDLEKETTPR